MSPPSPVSVAPWSLPAYSSIIGTVGDARHRNRASMTSKQLFEKLQPEYELHGGEWKKRQVCVQF